MSISLDRAWLALVLLLVGCGSEYGDAKLLCSLDGEAYFMEWRIGSGIRRVEHADRLCPKAPDRNNRG